MRGAVEHVAEVDEQITKHAEHWRMERMPSVDRNILRLAVYEMAHGGTPAAVTIDEALELARKFSNEESVQFVNGVLDTPASSTSNQAAPALSVVLFPLPRCHTRHSTPVVPFRCVLIAGTPVHEQVGFDLPESHRFRQTAARRRFPLGPRLSRAMKIHANTAQKVIGQLTAEGLLEVRPGIGTVVCQPPGCPCGPRAAARPRCRAACGGSDEARTHAGRTAIGYRRVLARPAPGGGWMIRTWELTKKYPRNEALHGVTLDVPEGAVFALLGPNGAGKSTAIKT